MPVYVQVENVVIDIVLGELSYNLAKDIFELGTQASLLSRYIKINHVV